MKIAAILLCMAASAYVGYNYANKACELERAEFINKLNENTLKIQSSLSTLAQDLEARNSVLSADINTILSKVKRTVIVKEGKCVVDPNFVQSVNNVVKKVNEAAK